MQKRTVKLFISAAVLVVLALAVGQRIVQSADDVTTKVVGFVKADKGQGFYFYSIPFKQIGAETQVHPLNIDNDNDGQLDGFAPGIFSDQNFNIDDNLRKFNSVGGTFTTPVFFKTVLGKTGWFRQSNNFPFFELSDMTLQGGEGFLIEYVSPPENDSSIFLLGEVNEANVEMQIEEGYNLLGNPFPKSITPDIAFNDNDGAGFTPTAGVPNDAFNTGDFIRANFDGSSWLQTAVYIDHPLLGGKGWYKQSNNFPFFEATDISIEPGRAFLYFSRNSFVWKQESPLQEQQ